MTTSLVTPPASPVRGTSTRRLGADEIRALLPHSFPFLFLDRVTELEPMVRGRGLKNVSINEPYFAGHFPHESIMPGVLVIETLAQLAGIVLAAPADSADAPATGSPPTRCFLAQVGRMRFREPVRPGDQLDLEAVRSGGARGLVEFRVVARVAGKPVVEGSLMLATDAPSPAEAGAHDAARPGDPDSPGSPDSPATRNGGGAQ